MPSPVKKTISAVAARMLEFSSYYRIKVLVASAAATILIGVVDWVIKSDASLGYLYIVPVLMAAPFLDRWQIVIHAAICAVLRERLEPVPADDLVLTREFLVLLAFAASGLLVKELVEGQRRAIEHAHELEGQIELRQSVEEQLNVLIESTPAAIFLLGPDGRVLSVNGAAGRLMQTDKEKLLGRAIEEMIPDLARIPVAESSRIFRTTMECTGRRENGSLFLAEVLVSAYRTPSGPRLAAIVLDLSEELRDREDTNLDNLMATSRILVGAVLHEIRNLCAAAAVAHANMARNAAIASSEDFKVLGTLVEGLEKVSSSELKVISDREKAAIGLRNVLEEFRIVVEPSVQEIGGVVLIESPEEPLLARIDAHSLLQVLLNLARNSVRAMAGAPDPIIEVKVQLAGEQIQIRFGDTGEGVDDPERLFQPFQSNSESAGLGLYVSRAILRSFGGELSYEPASEGSCFVIRLRRVHSRKTVQDDDNRGKETNSSPDRGRPHAVPGRPVATA